MTPKQITLVQNSWRLLRDVDPRKVGDLFYSKLFFDHPQLRPMFPQDMFSQEQKLIQMLSMIVARLHQINELAEDVAALAQRHVQYGVTPAHYEYVGEALLWTLERGLGSDWTPEVAEAWAECYTVLSNAMLQSLEKAA